MQCHQAQNTITRVLGRGNHSSGFACKDSVGIYNDLFAPNWYLDQVLTAATLGARKKNKECSQEQVCNANPTHVNMISFLTARKLKVHLVLFLSVTLTEIKLPRSFRSILHSVCLKEPISSHFWTSCNSK